MFYLIFAQNLSAMLHTNDKFQAEEERVGKMDVLEKEANPVEI